MLAKLVRQPKLLVGSCIRLTAQLHRPDWLNWSPVLELPDQKFRPQEQKVLDVRRGSREFFREEGAQVTHTLLQIGPITGLAS